MWNFIYHCQKSLGSGQANQIPCLAAEERYPPLLRVLNRVRQVMYFHVHDLSQSIFLTGKRFRTRWQLVTGSQFHTQLPDSQS